jgi:arsenate reductase (thioredoxin)
MTDRKRVLILCTGNSARSQMAEALLRSMGGLGFEVASAGVSPARVRPEAVEVMREIGVDISQHRSKSVDEYLGSEFDYVITVCDNANEQCPVFPGKTQRIHWSFDDPAAAEGDELARLGVFRRVRDEIAQKLRDFVEQRQLQPSIVCDMRAIPAEERPKHISTSKELFSRIAESRELENGYEFRLTDDRDLLVKLAEFISLEKLCCPFLNFQVEVNAAGGPVFLRLTGPEGVKEFIREEIG